MPTIVSPESVVAPAASVPVVDRFSFTNVIAPDESVMLPLANVRLPIVEPVAADIGARA